jgi:2-iminobutanoate/2-iminopropanoate deaminase
MFKPLAAVLAVLSCSAVTPVMAAAPTIQYFSNGSAPGPFSSAVRIGDMVYISGVIGVDSNGALPPDFTAQATNAMQAIGGELKLAGASMDDVFKCDVALADMKNWPAFNPVYVKYFKPGRLPVRMASGANGLAKGAAVEIECQAYSPR